VGIEAKPRLLEQPGGTIFALAYPPGYVVSSRTVLAANRLWSRSASLEAVGVHPRSEPVSDPGDLIAQANERGGPVRICAGQPTLEVLADPPGFLRRAPLGGGVRYRGGRRNRSGPLSLDSFDLLGKLGESVLEVRDPASRCLAKLAGHLIPRRVKPFAKAEGDLPQSVLDPLASRGFKAGKPLVQPLEGFSQRIHCCGGPVLDLVDPDGDLVDPQEGRFGSGFRLFQADPDSLQSFPGARLAFLHLLRKATQRGLQRPKHALVTIRARRLGLGGSRARHRIFKPSKRRPDCGLQTGDRLASARLGTLEPVGQPVENLRQPTKFAFGSVKGILHSARVGSWRVCSRARPQPRS